MYKQIRDFRTSEIDKIILRLSDNSYIPFDPANIDYQAYLEWIAEGNTPLPPDEPVEETP